MMGKLCFLIFLLLCLFVDERGADGADWIVGF